MNFKYLNATSVFSQSYKRTTHNTFVKFCIVIKDINANIDLFNKLKSKNLIMYQYISN